VKFDFLRKRTAFRFILGTLDHAFKIFQKCKTDQIDDKINNYISHYFPDLMTKLSSEAKKEFAGLMKVLLFNHRH